jgi:arylsulfatase A-like enzyme
LGETAAARDGIKPAQGVRDPVTIADLHATMLAALGIDPAAEFQTPIKRPMKWSEGQVIKRLLA